MLKQKTRRQSLPGFFMHDHFDHTAKKVVI